MKTIFKIQRSLFTTLLGTQVLIYNEARTIQGQIPLTPEIAQLFPPDVHKIFAEGTVDDTGTVTIEGQLWPDPDAFDW